MKINNIHRIILALFMLPALGPIGAFAGTIVTGKSIVFTSEDFASGSSATKNWAAYDGSSVNDSEVWASLGIAFNNNGFSNYSTLPDSYIIWKFIVPESYTITGFDWAVRQLILNGAPEGDDHFTWSYSTDGVNWTTFFDRENRKSTDTGIVYLNHQVYKETLQGTSITSTLYIRAKHVEGTEVSNDSGFFSVVSKVAAGGGIDPNSYITLHVTAIPEPAAATILMSVLGFGCAAVLATCRLRRRRGN